jgi:MoaA/NifB/PqqE/SkfB family radical SAM enzyme
MATSDELKINEIKTIINKLPQMKFITLIGGEPFMRKDIYDILAYLKEKNIKVNISTNGTLINTEKLKEFDNIVKLHFSIDGTEKINNTIRGKGSFKRIIKMINDLNGKFPIFCTTVIFKENLNDLVNIIDIAKQNNFAALTYAFERKFTEQEIKTIMDVFDVKRDEMPLYTSSIDKENHAKFWGYEFHDLLNTLLKLEEKAKREKVIISYFPYDLMRNKNRLSDLYYNRRPSESHFCQHLFKGRIDCYGNIIYCCYIKKKFGNLLENDFKSIWNSKEFVRFREKIHKLKPRICDSCSKWV